VAADALGLVEQERLPGHGQADGTVSSMPSAAMHAFRRIAGNATPGTP
jgi:hypothetical protein